MLMVLIVVLVVSGGLMLGAAWGVYWQMSARIEGFLADGGKRRPVEWAIHRHLGCDGSGLVGCRDCRDILLAAIASLATKVLPTAYRKDRHLAGVATPLGLVLAFPLGKLGA